MSRSFKHRPVSKGGGFGKIGKRLANKKVRKALVIAKGKAYKKLYNTWNINDFIMDYDHPSPLVKYLKEKYPNVEPLYRRYMK